jgi:hypothetical protein
MLPAAMRAVLAEGGRCALAPALKQNTANASARARETLFTEMLLVMKSS